MADIVGVYRSEKYVVVERHHHRFPPQCIWCSNALAESEMPGSPDRDGDIKPPMCRSCSTTRKRLPKTVGIFGVVTIIAAPLVYSSLGVMVAGALLLTGFIDLAVAWRLYIAAGGFSAVRADEQYVWIRGAHGSFLAALPQWNGMKMGEMAAR